MQDLAIVHTAVTHQVQHAITRLFQADATDPAERDRGAVSLEQVLWFVAAGVSVAVISKIIWDRIKGAADSPINLPVAP